MKLCFTCQVSYLQTFIFSSISFLFLFYLSYLSNSRLYFSSNIANSPTNAGSLPLFNSFKYPCVSKLEFLVWIMQTPTFEQWSETRSQFVSKSVMKIPSSPSHSPVWRRSICLFLISFVRSSITCSKGSTRNASLTSSFSKHSTVIFKISDNA